MSEPLPKTYADFWDGYVDQKLPKLPKGVRPGDEWGNQTLWNRLFDKMFRQHLPLDTKLALEIGPGAGKYTVMFLEAFAQSSVIAADVSKSYLAVLEKECQQFINAKRLFPSQI